MALSKEEQAELDALEAEGFKGLTAAEEQELAELEAELETPGDKMKRYAAGGFGALAKGLDVLRGAATGPALAGVLELATGKDVYRGGEHVDAINPTNLDTFPDAGTLYERAGIPEGASASDVVPGLYSEDGDEWLKFKKGGIMDPTVRGASGVATDMAIDPLSWLSFGGSAALKELAKRGTKGAGALRALESGAMVGRFGSELAARRGRSLYRAGILDAAQVGERQGKNVAESFYKRGIRGHEGTIAKEAEQAMGELKRARDAILKEADASGAVVDRGQAFADFGNMLTELQNKRLLSPEQANKIFNETIGSYMTGADPSTMLATEWKTQVGKKVKKAAYDVTGDSDLATKLKQVAAGGLQKQVERSVGARGDELRALNSELGDFLTVRKPVRAAAERAEKRRWLTPMDAVYATGGLGASYMSNQNDPYWALYALAGKKMLVDIPRTSSFRTRVGSALRGVGESDLGGTILDSAARETLKSATRKKKEKDDE